MWLIWSSDCIWHLAALSAVLHIVSPLSAPCSWSTDTWYITSLVLTAFFHFHIQKKNFISINVSSLVTNILNVDKEPQHVKIICAVTRAAADWHCWFSKNYGSHISALFVTAYEVKFKPPFHYCTFYFQLGTDCNVPEMQNAITQSFKGMCIWVYIVLCFVNALLRK